MIVVNILIGLVGLGFVVFIHELGHLVAAKLVGIDVEAFSLGWGKKLAGFTWRGTEYRISVFPVGGFCKMKGERSYAQALDENRSEIPHEPGSFFGAAPWRRIVALLAGPLANITFAVLILGAVWMVGFSTETYQNRIILASEYQSDASAEPSPADTAGLRTGDIILSLGNQEVRSYSDIQQIIAQNALTEMTAVVSRDNVNYQLSVNPALDTESGAGYLGVYPWVDPVVARVEEGSPAQLGGMLPGDRITAVSGITVDHTLDIGILLSTASFPVDVELIRDGQTLSLAISGPGETQSADEGIVLGVAFQTLEIASPDLNVFQALGKGAVESMRILVVSVRGLRLLFKGVEITSAVAGPVRISYYIGDIATSGFAIGFGAGVRALSNFLALLSVVLFFMNLLPIPVLDGGQIVLAGIEWIRGKSPHPRSVYRYQLFGGVMIFAILIVALFGDILFLAGR
jgi:regulator of sigma E protease